MHKNRIPKRKEIVRIAVSIEPADRKKHFEISQITYDMRFEEVLGRKTEDTRAVFRKQCKQ